MNTCNQSRGGGSLAILTTGHRSLALVLDVGILTGNHDFLGCGCPTWTVETLQDELRQA